MDRSKKKKLENNDFFLIKQRAMDIQDNAR
jgi:hypothetical protein